MTNGKGDSYIGAIVGWGGSGTRIIQTTFEKGTYEGVAASSIAFCWKDNNTYAPSTSGGNYYFSDLGHSDGAEQLVSVASGTEGLEITYDYTWKDVYHGAMTKATSGTHTYFTIGDTFYTTSGGSASFRLAYPTDWNVTGIYSNGTEITGYEGLYTISNITASTSITATYSIMLVELKLNDANSNKEALENYLGRKVNTLTLSGRTLYKDGGWNTLCLPFDVPSLAGTPLEGAKVMEMNTAKKNGFDTTSGTLYLAFKNATQIEAGKPYLVKWASGTDIVEPVFSDVTISSTTPTAAVSATSGLETVRMVGNYAPVDVKANDPSILFMGDGSSLYYTTEDRSLRNFRAHFEIPSQQSAPALARSFVIDFDGDEVVTGIDGVRIANDGQTDDWYSLDGRRLDRKPTRKGVYIHNGNKVIIK